jgi:hypothetical protein
VWVGFVCLHTSAVTASDDLWKGSPAIVPEDHFTSALQIATTEIEACNEHIRGDHYYYGARSQPARLIDGAIMTVEFWKQWRRLMYTVPDRHDIDVDLLILITPCAQRHDDFQPKSSAVNTSKQASHNYRQLPMVLKESV